MKLVDLDDHIYCGEDGDYARYNIDQNIPTIDAVPVVRCRDCRWHEQEQPGMVYCPRIVGNWVEECWFCADGEEREDGK